MDKAIKMQLENIWWRITACCCEKHCPQMYELVKPRAYTHTGVRMRHARFFSAIKRFAVYTSLYTRFYFYRFFLRICARARRARWTNPLSTIGRNENNRRKSRGFERALRDFEDCCLEQTILYPVLF